MLATCFVQPLDLLKNRMQLSGQGGGAKEHKTSFHLLKSIVRNEGLFTLYTGLSAGLLRQATYTTTRLGIYTWLFETFSKDGVAPNFVTKAALGMAAGVCGAFVGEYQLFYQNSVRYCLPLLLFNYIPQLLDIVKQ